MNFIALYFKEFHYIANFISEKYEKQNLWLLYLSHCFSIFHILSYKKSFFPLFFLWTSIKSQEDFAKKYQTMDCHLESSQKRRMPVKLDGHFLPRAIITVLKKQTWYYSSWMSDQAKTTKLDLKEYEEKKDLHV